MSLVSEQNASVFVKELKQKFYTDERLARYGKKSADLDSLVFLSRPGNGTCSIVY